MDELEIFAIFCSGTAVGHYFFSLCTERNLMQRNFLMIVNS